MWLQIIIEKKSPRTWKNHVNNVTSEFIFAILRHYTFRIFYFFQVLLAFGYLIVGFALSFAVLFHGNDQFHDFWRAIVKTVVMMMGEYEYNELFDIEKDFLPITSRIVFFVFTMLASIVLINLMIGLAVNDIQGLEKEVWCTNI